MVGVMAGAVALAANVAAVTGPSNPVSKGLSTRTMSSELSWIGFPGEAAAAVGAWDWSLDPEEDCLIEAVSTSVGLTGKVDMDQFHVD